MRIALYDPTFAEVHHLESRANQIDPLLQYIDSILAQRHVQDRAQSQELVRWIGRLVSHRLSIPASAVVLEYTCGATSALDAYSTFLTADQLDEVYSQIEGNFVGLGIELKAEEDALLIANVIPNGPADRAGILAGERIVAVNGTSTKEVSTDRAADMLKGEQGTYVEVTMLATSGDMRRLNVRRERVEVPSVEDVRILDPATGVAYFRISSFQKTTSRDVDAALWKLHREGMQSLVVDVRGNPGGLLNESVEVADRFVTEGTIVATHGRSARENYDYKAHRVGTWRVPLVVLIDGDSASASEIFAGAIRDHRRGTVVGDRSYGKGSVQGHLPAACREGGRPLDHRQVLFAQRSSDQSGRSGAGHPRAVGQQAGCRGGPSSGWRPGRPGADGRHADRSRDDRSALAAPAMPLSNPRSKRTAVASCSVPGSAGSAAWGLIGSHRIRTPDSLIRQAR